MSTYSRKSGYDKISNSMQGLLIQLSLDGKFIFVNQEASRFFGKSSDQLLQQNFREYLLRDDLKRIQQIFEKIRQSKKATFKFSAQHIVPTGIRIVDWKGSLIKENDAIIGFQLVGKDRTKTQWKLLEKNKLAILGEHVAEMVHELNNRLTDINLTAEYLLKLIEYQKEPLSTDILRGELLDIKKQVKYAALIIKKFLQFSNKLDLNLEQISIKPLFSELIETPAISSKIKAHQIEIYLRLEDDVQIYGDKLLLLHAFENILMNALDALEGISRKPEIKIISTKKENEVEIKIIDNGIGIKESDLPKIFDPFFTTKKAGKGTGLGLSISRKIILKHGGKISIKSTYRKGTQVSIILPLLDNFGNYLEK